MHLVNESDVFEFCNSNPRLDDLVALSVHELRLITQYLELEIPGTANKQELLNEVANKLCILEVPLVGCEGDETSGTKESVITTSNFAMPTEQQASVPSALDIHVQLQHAQIMLEQSRINAEAETTKLETVRVQAQLEQGKFDHEVQMRQSRQNDFEITKYVKLVPEFNEHDVTKFFAMFENIALSLSWPKSK
ncbi:hypothetical protein Pmani_022208 [Petrolisthes manimaculis]|uniref:Uncharacterized protein n=1 Tax=Petrolisthes manimaculis TaxID=1843537 RepID=A0AAE1PCI9_9EUCA|nr:hypothetical protein Pmani_022208 [Petrolisthes manimaculis]